MYSVVVVNELKSKYRYCVYYFLISVPAKLKSISVKNFGIGTSALIYILCILIIARVLKV